MPQHVSYFPATLSQTMDSNSASTKNKQVSGNIERDQSMIILKSIESRASKSQVPLLMDSEMSAA